MTHNRIPTERTKSTILSYANQSDLRRAHNFAAAAQPVVKLDLATTPTPWSQEPHSIEPFIPEQERREQFTHQELPPIVTDRPCRATPTAIAATDFDFDARGDEEDPPFRTPESWLKPVEPEENAHLFNLGRHWNWSERSTAAFLGFAAGILIVVPIVLFLSLTSDQRDVPSQPVRTAAAEVQPAATQVAFAKSSISAGAWFDSRTAEAPRAENPTTLAIEVVSQAHQAIAEGRIDQARTILRAAASADTPRLWFMLAETYDPIVSMQSARTRSDSRQLKVADANFARFYYQQALTHGINEARTRLDGLTKQ